MAASEKEQEVGGMFGLNPDGGGAQLDESIASVLSVDFTTTEFGDTDSAVTFGDNLAAEFGDKNLTGEFGDNISNIDSNNSNITDNSDSVNDENKLTESLSEKEVSTNVHVNDVENTDESSDLKRTKVQDTQSTAVESTDHSEAEINSHISGPEGHKDHSVASEQSEKGVQAAVSSQQNREGVEEAQEEEKEVFFEDDSDDSIPSDFSDIEEVLEIVGTEPARPCDDPLANDRPPSDEDSDFDSDELDSDFAEEIISSDEEYIEEAGLAEEIISSDEEELMEEDEADDEEDEIEELEPGEISLHPGGKQDGGETSAATSGEGEKQTQDEENVETTTTKTKPKKRTPKDKTKDKSKEKGKEKKGRKRKKKGEAEDEKTPKKRKKSYERRNIRSLMKETQLEEETVKAQKEEMERRQRMLEKQESLKQSQLQSLLEDDEDEDDDDQSKPSPKIAIPTPTMASLLADRPVSKKVDPDVVEISSDEDDISLVPVEPSVDEVYDPHNSGSHVNDMMNQPDVKGRVLINVGHPPDEPDIFLAPQLSANVKPHQIGGIRFLYDNLVESLYQYKTSNGFGCILAHSMGLGKTLQVISFSDVFLRYTEGKKVLIIVPVNTLQNWLHEFNMWLPTKEKADQQQGVWPREFKVHVVNDNHKTTAARSKVVEDWYRNGGCLLMGYEMYRLLTSKKIGGRTKKQKNNEPVMIDLVEEEKTADLMFGLRSALISPGPDMVICDEGHRIKNSQTGISQALKNIKTRRRVVLTGYPLQNNLVEYWCMVDFVRPNFLGTRTEFSNMFERPITNGQCFDSTPQDQKLMRFRAHVLHSLLEGFVQRRSHDVLRQELPSKEEHVLLVRMSPIQRVLYREFMDDLKTEDVTGWTNSNTNPLKAFSVCCKIWNHPDILHQIVEQHKLEDNDLDIEEAKVDGTDPTTLGKKKLGRSKGSVGDLRKVGSSSSLMSQESGFSPYGTGERLGNTITYEWAHDLLKQYVPGVVANSGKLVILLSILEQSILVGDKILVFSQSLYTLNLIEEYLGRIKIPGTEDTWAKNKSYLRLDGSTPGQDREKMINQFNAPTNDRIHLFLLSTRAGCLGINLIGANRVVVFDASWNPCHDAQAVCRVYRYGQVKQCFVYRLVSDLTMEKKIYDRQISKQGMSDRVVDELNPVTNLTRKQVDILLQYDDRVLPYITPITQDEQSSFCDQVLCEVLNKHHQWLTKNPFTHESLLIDRKDERLTQHEKRLAKQGYEMEKKMSISYSRPSYSAYYPKPGGPPMMIPPNLLLPPNPIDLPRMPSYRNRPVASVRPMMLPRPPMMSTPIPMQPMGAMGHIGDRGQPIRTIPIDRGGHPIYPPSMSGPGASSGQGGASGSTPLPPQPPSKLSTGPALLKPGVSVQQVKLHSDIPVPGSSKSEGGPPQRIPAGETVLVIKTPKGVYIRTPQGKIFAVRSAPKGQEVGGSTDDKSKQPDEGQSSDTADSLPQAPIHQEQPQKPPEPPVPQTPEEKLKSIMENAVRMAKEGASTSLQKQQQQSQSSPASHSQTGPSTEKSIAPPVSSLFTSEGGLSQNDDFNTSDSDDEIAIVASKQGRREHRQTGPGGDQPGMFPFFAPSFSGPSAYHPQYMADDGYGGAGAGFTGYPPGMPWPSLPPHTQPLGMSPAGRSDSPHYFHNKPLQPQQPHPWLANKDFPQSLYPPELGSFSNPGSPSSRAATVGAGSFAPEQHNRIQGGYYNITPEDSNSSGRLNMNTDFVSDSRDVMDRSSRDVMDVSSRDVMDGSSRDVTGTSAISGNLVDHSLDSLVKDLGIEASGENSNSSSLLSDK